MANPRPKLFDQCRIYGHHWRPVDAWYEGRHKISQKLECSACGTERLDSIRVKGGKTIKRQYDYANGYCYSKGEEKKTRPELRLASLGVESDGLATESAGVHNGHH